MRTLLISAMILLTAAVGRAAVIGTFVEAEPTNTARALPPTWYTTADSRTDGLWEIDQSSAHLSWDIFYERDSVVAYQAQEPNAPMIATTIEGLTPGSSYDIRLVFGSHTVTNHSILAGLASDSLTMFDQTNSDLAVAGTFFYEDGYMNIRQVLLGTATADASGAITAYIKGNELGAGDGGKAPYDGLTYAAPGATGTGLIGDYIEAEPENTVNVEPVPTPPEWYTTEDSSSDALWEIDQGATSTHDSYSVLHEHDAVVAYLNQEPDAPMLATTIEGLTPGKSYDIRVLFGSHTAQDQRIYAGLSSDALTLYNQDNSILAVEGTLEYEDGIMNLRQALVGTAEADANGEIKVYITGDSEQGEFVWGRCMYDGVSYIEAGTGMRPGDANFDGDVDQEDAATLAENWLSTGADWSKGDFNGDKKVDDIDATIMAANWGPAVTANSSVPEPSAIVGLLCLALVLLRSAARRRA